MVLIADGVGDGILGVVRLMERLALSDAGGKSPKELAVSDMRSERSSRSLVWPHWYPWELAVGLRAADCIADVLL